MYLGIVAYSASDRGTTRVVCFFSGVEGPFLRGVNGPFLRGVEVFAKVASGFLTGVAFLTKVLYKSQTSQIGNQAQI